MGEGLMKNTMVEELVREINDKIIITHGRPDTATIPLSLWFEISHRLEELHSLEARVRRETLEEVMREVEHKLSLLESITIAESVVLRQLKYKLEELKEGK